MNTNMNIHDATDIEIGQSRKLNSGTWVRAITFRSPKGSMNITVYADDLDDVRLQFENLDD